MKTDCRDWIYEIVESARSGGQPGAKMRAHLSACAHCSARWESERRLTSALRILREPALGRRSSAARQIDILRAFDSRRGRSSRPPMTWLAAAAGLLVLVGGLAELRSWNRRAAPSQLAMVQESGGDPDADGNGFIDVPYAPPLATGELVSVVRTRLQPATLVRMGLPVDLASSGEIAADVMAGEDGLPRAVRLVEPSEF